jgi:sec-independent protein translocase protein TatC
MPLMEHIRELRTRLIKAAGAILAGSIVGFIFWQHLVSFLIRPLCNIPNVQGIGRSTAACHNGLLTLTGPTAGISLAFDVAIFCGLVLTSPIWLYQVWAFLAPGLYKKEKKYSLSFIAAAVPLFLAGASLCYYFFPTIIKVLVGSFTPLGVSANLPLDQMVVFFLRMMGVFGLSFVLPLILVLFNFIGILKGKTMFRWWRGIVMAIFVFSAVAVPTGDPIGMSVLAIPICVLYFSACGISVLNDRRRARRNPNAGLSPDQASELDLTPLPIERAQDLEDIL